MTIKELAAKFNISYQAAAGLLSFMRETGSSTQCKMIHRGKGKAPNNYKIDFEKFAQVMQRLQDHTTSAVITHNSVPDSTDTE